MKINKLCKLPIIYVLSPYMFGVINALISPLFLYFFANFAIAYNYSRYTHENILVIRSALVLVILLLVILAIFALYVAILTVGKEALSNIKTRIMFYIGLAFQLVFPIVTSYPVLMILLRVDATKILYFGL